MEEPEDDVRLLVLCLLALCFVGRRVVVVFLAAGFLAAVFFAAVFLAAGLLAAVFFAVVLLACGLSPDDPFPEDLLSEDPLPDVLPDFSELRELLAVRAFVLPFCFRLFAELFFCPFSLEPSSTTSLSWISPVHPSISSRWRSVWLAT